MCAKLNSSYLIVRKVSKARILFKNAVQLGEAIIAVAMTPFSPGSRLNCVSKDNRKISSMRQLINSFAFNNSPPIYQNEKKELSNNSKYLSHYSLFFSSFSFWRTRVQSKRNEECINETSVINRVCLKSIQEWIFRVTRQSVSSIGHLERASNRTVESSLAFPFLRSTNVAPWTAYLAGAQTWNPRSASGLQLFSFPLINSLENSGNGEKRRKQGNGGKFKKEEDCHGEESLRKFKGQLGISRRDEKKKKEKNENNSQNILCFSPSFCCSEIEFNCSEIKVLDRIARIRHHSPFLVQTLSPSDDVLATRRQLFFHRGVTRQSERLFSSLYTSTRSPRWSNGPTRGNFAIKCIVRSITRGNVAVTLVRFQSNE